MASGHPAAARAQLRQRVHEPPRRPRGPADRGGRGQGDVGGQSPRIGETRELHRGRPRRHRSRRASPHDRAPVPGSRSVRRGARAGGPRHRGGGVTERIQGEGASALSSDEVRALAGVEPGMNLLRLSLDAVTASLQRSPWVRDAAADRSLPATLVLRVAERRAVGLIEDPAGSVVVAEDGVAVSRTSAAPPDLPGLGTVAEPMAPGERLRGVATLDLAASMEDPLLAEVASIAEADGELLIQL